MQLYLPIADIPVNVFLILAMGAAVGFVSGMFGIGGGFLMTPLLIFLFNFNPATAIGTDILHGAIFKSFGAVRHRRLGTVRARLAGQALQPPFLRWSRGTHRMERLSA